MPAVPAPASGKAMNEGFALHVTVELSLRTLRHRRLIIVGIAALREPGLEVLPDAAMEKRVTDQLPGAGSRRGLSRSLTELEQRRANRTGVILHLAQHDAARRSKVEWRGREHYTARASACIETRMRTDGLVHVWNEIARGRQAFREDEIAVFGRYLRNRPLDLLV